MAYEYDNVEITKFGKHVGYGDKAVCDELNRLYVENMQHQENEIKECGDGE